MKCCVCGFFPTPSRRRRCRRQVLTETARTELLDQEKERRRLFYRSRSMASDCFGQRYRMVVEVQEKAESSVRARYPLPRALPAPILPGAGSMASPCRLVLVRMSVCVRSVCSVCSV